MALYVVLRIWVFPVMMFNYKPATMMDLEEFRFYINGETQTENTNYPYNIYNGDIEFVILGDNNILDVSTLRNIHIQDNLNDIAVAYSGIPCRVERRWFLKKNYKDIRDFAEKNRNRNLVGETYVYYTSYFVGDQPVTIREYKNACRNDEIKDDAWRIEMLFYLDVDKDILTINISPARGVSPN